MPQNHLGQPVGFDLTHWKSPPVPPKELKSGKFCRLEPLDVRHAPELFAANSLDIRGTMWTYLPYGPFETFADYEKWIAKISAGADPIFFAIIDAKTNNPVGVCSYLRIDPVNGVIEVGHLGFSPKLQKTAAATEAMFLMMSRAFELGYRRYEWKCDSLNAPSRAAALRLGFTFEGIFRQVTVYRNRNRDTAWFSIIDSEWPTLKKAFQDWLNPNNFDEKRNQKKSLGEFRK